MEGKTVFLQEGGKVYQREIFAKRTFFLFRGKNYQYTSIVASCWWLELDHRKCDCPQIEVMLYSLLDNLPDDFKQMTESHDYLVINNTVYSQQISSFLTNVLFPPIEHSAFVCFSKYKCTDSLEKVRFDPYSKNLREEKGGWWIRCESFFNSPVWAENRRFSGLQFVLLV